MLPALDRALFEPVLGALDVARARALRWTAPVTRTFVRDREARVVAAALVSCGFALVATGFATGWLLLLGPLFFGMPHLVAEARYLFFQRHRGDRRLLAVLALQSACAFAGFGVLALGPCCALALAVVARERSRTASTPRHPTSDRPCIPLTWLAILPTREVHRERVAVDRHERGIVLVTEIGALDRCLTARTVSGGP